MTTTERRSPRETIAAIVGRRAEALQRGYRANQPAQVAALARLRRGLGKQPGAVLDILQYTEAEELLGDWTSDEPNHAEIAAHHSLTLFALHQQSQKKPMHKVGQRFGRSLRALTGKDTDLKPENPVVRRFTMLATAESLDEVVHHLRGAVQLLRGKEVALDYGLLAADLLRWQWPGGPDRVRLTWGRDFYVHTPTGKAAN